MIYIIYFQHKGLGCRSVVLGETSSPPPRDAWMRRRQAHPNQPLDSVGEYEWNISNRFWDIFLVRCIFFFFFGRMRTKDRPCSLTLLYMHACAMLKKSTQKGGRHTSLGSYLLFSILYAAVWFVHISSCIQEISTGLLEDAHEGTIF